MNHETLDPSTPFAVVVNDDITQLNVLSGLVRKAGLEPRTFTEAEAALADMSAWAGTVDRDLSALPVLVVTDLYMPGIDGWRFCRLLRSPEYAAFNQVPILVVSATFAGDETDRIAADLGAEAFLPSPVNGKHFVEQVLAILSGKRMRTPLRVLIVEDSQTLSDILQKAFAAHGYQADAVITAREAVAAFGKTAYDVAVLDYHQPDGMGDALLDTFRAQRPDCVCLMMTTDSCPELALNWMKRGAAAYLQKPFQTEYLIELCARARRERALLRVQDLLEVRTAELRESEEKHRILLEESSDPIFSFTPEGQYKYVNRAFAEWVGKPFEGIIGKRTWDVFPKEAADLHYSSLNYAFRTGKEQVIEVRVPQAEGYRYFMTTIAPIKDTAGKVLSVICSSKDITERKRAEDELKSSLSLLSAALESTVDGLLIVNREGNVAKYNLKFAEMWRIPEDVIASYDDDVLLNHVKDQVADPGQFLAKVREIYAKPEKLSFDQIEFMDGRVFERYSQPQKIGNNVVGRVWSFRDITERKRAEAENAELEAQNRQLQKAESLGRMAGAIAHHFNNQLQVVMGNLEMAIDDLPRGSITLKRLIEALKAARKAAEVSGLMLIYLGQKSGTHVPLDLSEACRQSLILLRAAVPKDMILKASFPSTGPIIRANAGQIQQVLTNLVTNAWEATGESHGAIGLTVKSISQTNISASNRFPIDWQPQESVYACLEVADAGCGIVYKDIEKLFDPFFTNKFTGRGMGLSVVLGIVRAHNGGITVESVSGRGSAFRVFFPVSAEAVPHQPDKAAQIPEMKGSGTVLLVEDEEMVREIGATMLTHLGFRVIEAKDGVEAVEVFRQHQGQIRCVLSDLTMPRMDGWETLTALRRLSPDIPVILSSGYDEAQVMAEKHPELPDAFLGKPYKIKGLQETINRVLAAKNE
jgi:PAS domain S-box-containing protein